MSENLAYLPVRRGSRVRRHIDYLIGWPALFILGLCRSKRKIPDHIKVIGFLSLSAIGDTIIASGIANDLKAAFPSTKIIAFVGPSSRGIAQIITGFDEEITVPTTHPLRALRIIRQYPTDIIIDVMAWARVTALYAASSRTHFTVGFRTVGERRHWTFDRAIEHSGERHEIENYRALLQPFGIRGNSLPHAAAEFYARPRHSTNDRASTVVLHPWATGFRSNLREWPTENWAALARATIESGYRIVITGGSADKERALKLATAIDHPDHVMTLAGGANLADTATEIARAAAVVCVNTGIMHLAAALNTPLVALHGPTNPRRWGPLSKASITIVPPLGSQCGYLNHGFEYPANPQDCMADITINEVFAALRKALGQVPLAPSSNVPACEVE
jgi:heptosyltransferase-3